MLTKKMKIEKSAFNKYSHLFTSLFNYDLWERFEISYYMLSGNSEYTNDLDRSIFLLNISLCCFIKEYKIS